MYKANKIAHILPSFLIVVLVFFESSYNSLLSFGQYTPFYDLIILFYFCFFLPEALPFVLLILLGLLKDFLFMTPLGISSVSFVVLKLLLQKQIVLVKDRLFFTVFTLFLIDVIIISLLQILIVTAITDISFMTLVQLFARRFPATMLLYIPFYFIFTALLKKPSIENV